MTPRADRAARVLIVDDEPGILKMFKTALGNYGIVTEGAHDGDEAIERLAEGAFDAIVSDVNMPGCDGLELLRTVRALGYDIPVIIMTGRPNVDSARIVTELGAFRFVVKPVMPATLRAILEAAMNEHATSAAKRGGGRASRA